MKRKLFVSIISLVCLLCVFTTSILAMNFPFRIYVDGQEIFLNRAIVKDGHTYVQLRELVNKMGDDVKWVGFHLAPSLGGNLPEGININHSNILHTKDISSLFDGEATIGVEMTSLLNKYNKNESDKFKYYFEKYDKSGLYIKNDGGVKFIPITFYNYMGLSYVTADDFKTKIQPYFIDICMQK